MEEADGGKTKIDIDAGSVHITGDDCEKVYVGPGGVHIKDGDSEVKVSWTGVRIKDGKTNLEIGVWKPLLGCGFALLLFAGLLTAVVVGVVKLMT